MYETPDKVDGVPAPEVKWFRDGQALADSQDGYLIKRYVISLHITANFFNLELIVENGVCFLII